MQLQLKCIGGSGRGLYEVDVMRCKNSGSDYDENSIQWTCTASLPEEFKLGSTEVICEGYDYPDDPYILKGSCGVEYRLVLTDKGKERYGKGKGGGWLGDDDEHPKTTGENVAAAAFWLLFIGVALWMVYSAFTGWAQRPAGGPAGGNRPGWGGGGGGGWGGGNNDPYDDPSPPYYPSNPRNSKSGYGATEGWRPGFWSGAMGGAAAGWAAGRMGNRGNQTGSGWGGRSGSSSGGGWNNGEGSSRSSSGDSFSSTRYESTGFGSTSRR